MYHHNKDSKPRINEKEQIYYKYILICVISFYSEMLDSAIIEFYEYGRKEDEETSLIGSLPAYGNLIGFGDVS